MKIDEKIISELRRHNEINSYIIEQEVADPLAEPTGTESRSPDKRSATATQIRKSPWRLYNCALSPVASRSADKTGPAAAMSRSSPAAAPSSLGRGPKTKRPVRSRVTSR